MKNIIVLATVIVALASGCRGWESEKPPFHLNPNMDTQKKLKSYGESTFFANGRTMQMPVEGTVVRTVAGDAQLDADAVAADPAFYTGLVDDKPVLDFPAAVDTKAAGMKRGENRYNIYCAPCHGVDADGKGPVAAKYPVPPPSFHQERLWYMPLGDLYRAIAHGKNAPNMPSYADKLTPSDRWAVVAYLRSTMMSKNSTLTLSVDPSKVAADPSSLAGDPVAMGEALHKKVCIACHSVDGSRLVGPSFKGIVGRAGKLADGTDYVADEAYIKESILNPNAKIVESYPPAMPPQTLSDDEVAALIAFMKSIP